MPVAETNGKANHNSEEDVLAWDTGVSKCVSRLEEDLIRWNSEQCKRAKERQIKGSRALKDIASVEQQVNHCAAAKIAKINPNDPLKERLEVLVHKATVQREEMCQVLDLLGKHAKSHFSSCGGPDFVDTLPAVKEGAPLATSGDEVLRHLKSFLDLAERKLQEAVGSSRRRQRDGDGREENGQRGARDERPPPRDERQLQRERRDDAVGVLSEESRSRSPIRNTPALTPRREAPARGAAPRGAQREADAPPPKRTRDGRGANVDPAGEDSYYSAGEGSLSPEPQKRQVDSRQTVPGRRGSAEGGDRSRRTRGGDISHDIERFVRINRIDRRTEDMVRDLAPDDAREVMGLTGRHQFELGPDVRDPTNVIVSRIRRLREDAGGKGGGGRARQRTAGDSRSPGRQDRRPESRPQYDRRGPPARARDSRSRSPKGGNAKGSGKHDPRQLFVAGVGDVPEHKVRALFEEVGDVERLKFLTNSDGSSKGVCFVTYRTEQQADKALDLNGEELSGKKLIVRIASAPKGGQGGQGGDRRPRRRDSRSPSPKGKGKGKNDPRQVFISGIGDLSENKVRSYFEEIGDIERIKLLTTPEGEPKGVGFVTFRTEGQAERAVDRNGDDCCGRQLQIRYAN